MSMGERRKNLNQESQSQDLNPGRPKYKSGAVPLGSVMFFTQLYSLSNCEAKKYAVIKHWYFGTEGTILE